ncbi:WAT1-related protein At5g07050 isoform X3 [Cryptomeria japonica]|uniref:WAT1-related protein At5g07050 isoform X3 n=1 Tax=Cryptomeria japonica TaxID=3369 RepID=UPI0027DA1496|nr:WAT1-related protein At5g07050 isoform X3 [Cryptomeria japonica]
MAEFGKCLFGCLPSFYEKSKPALAMIIVQICFAGLNILSKIALNQGMSHYVLIFYRQLFATIATAPVAYILERKTRPKLTIRIFGEIFICSFLGISLNMNFYYTGLSYTTATFSTALLNLVPAITFLMAIVFRGIKIQLWPSPFDLSRYTKSNTTTEDFTKGSLFVVMGCICFSTWFILQTHISKKYPVQYSSTAISFFLATIQCAVITLIFERGHYGVWVLGWNVKLLTAIYSGVIASGVAFCLMAWCIKKRGPIFTTMFGPLVLVIVALFGSILLDEKFYLGSVIGAILIVIGLYIMLWSKSKEMEKIVKIPSTPSSISSSKESNNVEQKEDLINI